MQCFEILPQLYLSQRSFASCKECLLANNITHVLTIDNEELTFKNCGNHDTSNQSNDVHLHFKFVYALDQLNFNILELFGKTIEYIKEWIESSSENKVLVHW